ncbi:Ycf66 family protein [Oculatella sp. LEGE 06141]|uniref:Ycf66 family protein n=1 Tax=Oculatella sp. LEGE 06141 TaxID=1828648 RepID=UPI00187E8301|nr:Ycf66 family protein [Oculatella sp. LEGE 06141]MBE9179181.1 Ycf66 family protein [Oculatella sp. LEGE 06141]
MVNVGLSWSSMVGIALAVSGAGLYFLRSVRPNLARDHDIFFAAVALLCGGILFFQGWRQDPILQFGQFMLTGSTIWFAFEAIRLRGVATEQAKRSTPVVDDERPVSRVYRAELDELTPLEEQRTVTRRIRGTRDGRPAPVEEYGDEVRRRPPSSRSISDERYGATSSDRPRKRRPSARPEGRPSEQPGVNSVWDDDFADSSRGSAASRSSARSSGSASSKSRRSRSQGGSARRSVRSEQSSADYVDYQPVDYSDDEPGTGFE